MKLKPKTILNSKNSKNRLSTILINQNKNHKMQPKYKTKLNHKHNSNNQTKSQTNKVSIVKFRKQPQLKQRGSQKSTSRTIGPNQKLEKRWIANKTIINRIEQHLERRKSTLGTRRAGKTRIKGSWSNVRSCGWVTINCSD